MITGSACHSGPFVTATLTVVMAQRNAKTTAEVTFFFLFFYRIHTTGT